MNIIHRKQHAFTLMEILVALAIFAVVGVLAALILTRTIHTHSHVKRVEQRLQNLAFTVALIKQDSREMVNHAVIEGGQASASLVSLPNQSVEFTRATHDGNLLRVQYRVVHHRLMRLLWRVKNSKIQGEPSTLILLHHVQLFKIQYVDDHSKIYTTWPVVQSSAQRHRLPKAVIITMTLKHHGNVTVVLPIISRGAYVRTTSIV